MNMNRLINMGLRMLMNNGIKVAANRGKNPEDMTPEERQSAQATQQNLKKARRGMRMMRRFMR
ncbi:hypothetical protein SAMN04488005_1594 [Yoonia tamlensis]|uniref:Uncharacterized protein n=1 Tax=Yoonia tamlensis TaxID=390270 RepID=A0A1I6GG02_9RHOB|nr:hypothetical protein [Yoonia tamlensis]SFR41051.1 hypothetical protein SAMN04488005_1594 [Yoonia tamlensis]